MLSLRILSESQVKALVSMREAIDIQREAFALQARGDSVTGLRHWLHMKDNEPECLVGFLPAFLTAGRGFGVKIVSDFYGQRGGQRGHDLPHMMAIVVVCDGRTGAPRAVMEGGHLTDLRTGAATGLAVELLARRDARVATIFGAGRMARNQLEAICEVRELETVWICSRTEARSRAYIAEMQAKQGRIPVDIRLARSPRDCVPVSDIVITATTAEAPVFAGADLRPGTCVVAGGAYREVDEATVRRAAKVVVDMKENVHSPVLKPLLEAGVLQAAEIAELGELVLGRRPGRESAEEITFCKTEGVPTQDLVTAQHILRRAEEQGIGTLVPIL
ncbi:MAG: ornithine cyclodeaminase family protein [Candidatus Rokuibacteriota bacterium]